MNIKHILAILCLVVMLTACSSSVEQEVQIDAGSLPDQGQPIVEEVTTSPVEQTNPITQEPTSNPLVDDTTADASSDSKVKEFEIVAKRFEFVPNVINVNRGDRVILHVTAADVMHGISIPEMGVNEQLPPGETKDIEFIADEPGEFNFRCSVFCGSGHTQQKGMLIVQ